MPGFAVGADRARTSLLLCLQAELRRARARAAAQNKLHRNAGPEDLAATEAMLARVTAPGAAFAPAFVAEFRTFTAELRDFFNAGAFADMLALLRPSLPDDALQARARGRAAAPGRRARRARARRTHPLAAELAVAAGPSRRSSV